MDGNSFFLLSADLLLQECSHFYPFYCFYYCISRSHIKHSTAVYRCFNRYFYILRLSLENEAIEERVLSPEGHHVDLLLISLDRKQTDVFVF